MNRSAELDADGCRRSKRIRRLKPEFSGLEGSERTPAKPDASYSKEKRDFNHNSETKEEVKHRLPAYYEDSLNGGNINIETRQIFSRRKITSEIIINGNQSIEPQVTKKYAVQSHVSENQRQRIQSNESSSMWKIILGIVSIIFTLIFLINKVSEGETSADLKRLFPQQSNQLWGFVTHGLVSTEPFVLLLVHDGDAELANCLAWHIAVKVGTERTKRTVDPIILDGRNDHSNLLVTLKPQIEKHHALVLQNVEHMHGKVADNLHFILDTFEPWVPGGVYVLTLHVPNIDNNSKESFRTIQTFLRRKWSGIIRDDDLDPLISRICNFDYVIKKDTSPCKQNL